jgi:hypothetical protein
MPGEKAPGEGRGFAEELTQGLRRRRKALHGDAQGRFINLAKENLGTRTQFQEKLLLIPEFHVPEFPDSWFSFDSLQISRYYSSRKP